MAAAPAEETGKLAPRLIFDATHLVSRQGVPTPTGIDRVDTAYALHLTGAPGALHAGLHYGLRAPHLFGPGQVADLARRQAAAWRDAGALSADADFAAVRAFLTGEAGDAAATIVGTRGRRRPSTLSRIRHHLSRPMLRYRTMHEAGLQVPQGAVYLNVAQHLVEMPFLFRWLDARPDVKAVFMLHDMLPLDYPEYFPASREELFRRMNATVMRHARGLIVTCEASKAAILRHLHAAGGPRRLPVLVQPLPAEAAFHAPAEPDPALAASPYLVTVGTVEPRKNHLLLLHLWRRFAEEGVAAPKLLMVGAVGWENEDVLDMLDRCSALRGRVLLATGLSDAAYRHLLGHARALLAPSHAEGYGIPLVEALTCGTPVIASDIPAFREVSQGLGTFHHPLDGRAWREAVLPLGEPAAAADRRAAVRAFRAPTWDGYFQAVSAFLAQLGAADR